ncbi:hypothetical protein I5U39_03085 [Stenotrophomonas maltophilia]|nr:hypothetical protein [Stenotrophomonas maltophilia]
MAKVLESSFELATKLIGALSMSAKEYEETLTGTLLGSLLSTNTVLGLVSAHLDVEPANCWWGSYSKSRSKDDPYTEAASGADFGLLTLLDTGRARLALFQAKRGDLKEGIWSVDVNRVPPRPKDLESKPRKPQMVVLVETARRLTELADPAGHQASKLAPLEPDSVHTQEELTEARLAPFDWVHYLVYTDDGAECLPLRQLSSAYVKELVGRRSETNVPIEGRTSTFLEVISHGCVTGAPNWLEFDDADTAIRELPLLLSLVPIVVGDSDGTHGPALKKINGLAPLTLNLSQGHIANFMETLSANAGDEGYVPARPS